MPPIGGYYKGVAKPHFAKNTMEITREQLTELREVIEDTVEYFADKHMVSGELVWTCVESLGTAKLAELRGELAAV